MKPTQRNYSLLLSIAAIAFGAFMIIDPVDATGLIIRITGIALLAMSVMQISNFVKMQKQQQAQWGIGIFATILVGAGSCIIIVAPSIAIGIFMFIIGAFVALLGVWQYMVLEQYRRGGVRIPGRMYITPSVLVVCGAGSMFFPGLSNQVLTIGAGVLLILFGVSELMGYFTIQPPQNNQ